MDRDRLPVTARDHAAALIWSLLTTVEDHLLEQLAGIRIGRRGYQ